MLDGIRRKRPRRCQKRLIRRFARQTKFVLDTVHFVGERFGGEIDLLQIFDQIVAGIFDIIERLSFVIETGNLIGGKRLNLRDRISAKTLAVLSPGESAGKSAALSFIKTSSRKNLSIFRCCESFIKKTPVEKVIFNVPNALFTLPNAIFEMEITIFRSAERDFTNAERDFIYAARGFHVGNSNFQLPNAIYAVETAIFRVEIAVFNVEITIFTVEVEIFHSGNNESHLPNAIYTMEIAILHLPKAIFSKKFSIRKLSQHHFQSAKRLFYKTIQKIVKSFLKITIILLTIGTWL